MRSIPEILAGGEFVSGEAISRELGITRAAVWKRIHALQQEGWQIESRAKNGYRLVAGDSLRPEVWTSLLETKVIGRGENRFLDTVDSTNLQVKQMALAGAPSGSFCLAECQTAGKGRLGRLWHSPKGCGIWCSVLLRPALKPDTAPLITLCTALAMNTAIRETTGLDSRIKWPNDIVCDGKKLCGILLEMSADPDQIEYIVIGTGLNVYPGAYPEELKHRAAALSELSDTVPPRREIIAAYLKYLEKYTDLLVQEGFAGIRKTYTEQSITIGSRVQVTGSIELTGMAESIDDTGALMVRTDDGALQRVLSGDVSVRGVMGYV